MPGSHHKSKAAAIAERKTPLNSTNSNCLPRVGAKATSILMHSESPRARLKFERQQSRQELQIDQVQQSESLSKEDMQKRQENVAMTVTSVLLETGVNVILPINNTQTSSVSHSGQASKNQQNKLNTTNLNKHHRPNQRGNSRKREANNRLSQTQNLNGDRSKDNASGPVTQQTTIASRNSLKIAEWAAKKQKKQQDAKRLREERHLHDGQCTFQPVLNKKTNEILSRSSRYGGDNRLSVTEAQTVASTYGMTQSMVNQNCLQNGIPVNLPTPSSHSGRHSYQRRNSNTSNNSNDNKAAAQDQVLMSMLMAGSLPNSGIDFSCSQMSSPNNINDQQICQSKSESYQLQGNQSQILDLVDEQHIHKRVEKMQSEVSEKVNGSSDNLKKLNGIKKKNSTVNGKKKSSKSSQKQNQYYANNLLNSTSQSESEFINDNQSQSNQIQNLKVDSRSDIANNKFKDEIESTKARLEELLKRNAEWEEEYSKKRENLINGPDDNGGINDSSEQKFNELQQALDLEAKDLMLQTGCQSVEELMSLSQSISVVGGDRVSPTVVTESSTVNSLNQIVPMQNLILNVAVAASSPEATTNQENIQELEEQRTRLLKRLWNMTSEMTENMKSPVKVRTQGPVVDNEDEKKVESEINTIKFMNQNETTENVTVFNDTEIVTATSSSSQSNCSNSSQSPTQQPSLKNILENNNSESALYNLKLNGIGPPSSDPSSHSESNALFCNTELKLKQAIEEQIEKEWILVNANEVEDPKGQASATTLRSPVESESPTVHTFVPFGQLPNLLTDTTEDNINHNDSDDKKYNALNYLHTVPECDESASELVSSIVSIPQQPQYQQQPPVSPTKDQLKEHLKYLQKQIDLNQQELLKLSQKGQLRSIDLTNDYLRPDQQQVFQKSPTVFPTVTSFLEQVVDKEVKRTIDALNSENNVNLTVSQNQNDNQPQFQTPTDSDRDNSSKQFEEFTLGENHHILQHTPSVLHLPSPDPKFLNEAELNNQLLESLSSTLKQNQLETPNSNHKLLNSTIGIAQTPVFASTENLLTMSMNNVMDQIENEPQPGGYFSGVVSGVVSATGSSTVGSEVQSRSGSHVRADINQIQIQQIQGNTDDINLNGTSLSKGSAKLYYGNKRNSIQNDEFDIMIDNESNISGKDYNAGGTSGINSRITSGIQTPKSTVTTQTANQNPNQYSNPFSSIDSVSKLQQLQHNARVSYISAVNLGSISLPNEIKTISGGPLGTSFVTSVVSPKMSPVDQNQDEIMSKKINNTISNENVKVAYQNNDSNVVKSDSDSNANGTSEVQDPQPPISNISSIYDELRQVVEDEKQKQEQDRILTEKEQIRAEIQKLKERQLEQRQMINNMNVNGTQNFQDIPQNLNQNQQQDSSDPKSDILDLQDQECQEWLKQDAIRQEQEEMLKVQIKMHNDYIQRQMNLQKEVNLMKFKEQTTKALKQSPLGLGQNDYLSHLKSQHQPGHHGLKTRHKHQENLEHLDKQMPLPDVNDNPIIIVDDENFEQNFGNIDIYNLDQSQNLNSTRLSITGQSISDYLKKEGDDLKELIRKTEGERSERIRKMQEDRNVNGSSNGSGSPRQSQSRKRSGSPTLCPSLFPVTLGSCDANFNEGQNLLLSMKRSTSQKVLNFNVDLKLGQSHNVNRSQDAMNVFTSNSQIQTPGRIRPTVEDVGDSSGIVYDVPGTVSQQQTQTNLNQGNNTGIFGSTTALQAGHTPILTTRPQINNGQDPLLGNIQSTQSSTANLHINVNQIQNPGLNNQTNLNFFRMAQPVQGSYNANDNMSSPNTTNGFKPPSLDLQSNIKAIKGCRLSPKFPNAVPGTNNQTAPVPSPPPFEPQAEQGAQNQEVTDQNQNNVNDNISRNISMNHILSNLNLPIMPPSMTSMTKNQQLTTGPATVRSASADPRQITPRTQFQSARNRIGSLQPPGPYEHRLGLQNVIRAPKMNSIMPIQSQNQSDVSNSGPGDHGDQESKNSNESGRQSLMSSAMNLMAIQNQMKTMSTNMSNSNLLLNLANSTGNLVNSMSKIVGRPGIQPIVVPKVPLDSEPDTNQNESGTQAQGIQTTQSQTTGLPVGSKQQIQRSLSRSAENFQLLSHTAIGGAGISPISPSRKLWDLNKNNNVKDHQLDITLSSSNINNYRDQDQNYLNQNDGLNVDSGNEEYSADHDEIQTAPNSGNKRSSSRNTFNYITTQSQTQSGRKINRIENALNFASRNTSTHGNITSMSNGLGPNSTLNTTSGTSSSQTTSVTAFTPFNRQIPSAMQRTPSSLRKLNHGLDDYNTNSNSDNETAAAAQNNNQIQNQNQTENDTGDVSTINKSNGAVFMQYEAATGAAASVMEHVPHVGNPTNTLLTRQISEFNLNFEKILNNNLNQNLQQQQQTLVTQSSPQVSHQPDHLSEITAMLKEMRQNNLSLSQNLNQNHSTVVTDTNYVNDKADHSHSESLKLKELVDSVKEEIQNSASHSNCSQQQIESSHLNDMEKKINEFLTSDSDHSCPDKDYNVAQNQGENLSSKIQDFMKSGYNSSTNNFASVSSNNNVTLNTLSESFTQDSSDESQNVNNGNTNRVTGPGVVNSMTNQENANNPDNQNQNQNLNTTDKTLSIPNPPEHEIIFQQSGDEDADDEREVLELKRLNDIIKKQLSSMAVAQGNGTSSSTTEAGGVATQPVTVNQNVTAATAIAQLPSMTNLRNGVPAPDIDFNLQKFETLTDTQTQSQLSMTSNVLNATNISNVLVVQTSSCHDSETPVNESSSNLGKVNQHQIQNQVSTPGTQSQQQTPINLQSPRSSSLEEMVARLERLSRMVNDME